MLDHITYSPRVPYHFSSFAEPSPITIHHFIFQDHYSELNKTEPSEASTQYPPPQSILVHYLDADTPVKNQ